MNKKMIDKLVSIAKKLKDVPNSEKKHISFIIDKNRILSIGFNDSKATHRICKSFGFEFNGIHSEIDCLLNYQGWKSELKNCVLVNIRINRFNEIGMSKPCSHCQNMIDKIGFKRVFYTTIDGNFTRFK